MFFLLFFLTEVRLKIIVCGNRQHSTDVVNQVYVVNNVILYEDYYFKPSLHLDVDKIPSSL